MELRHVLTIDVAVRPMVDLGDFPLGGRRVVVFNRETFAVSTGERRRDTVRVDVHEVV